MVNVHGHRFIQVGWAPCPSKWNKQWILTSDGLESHPLIFFGVVSHRMLGQNSSDQGKGPEVAVPSEKLKA